SSVRPLKIVVVDEQTNAALGVAQVQEDCRLDAFPPQRSPEALDLAQRLRMTGGGDYLPDAALFQLAAERALAAPGHVLAAVVGQNLLGRAIRCQAGAQDFQDQSGRLTRM